jgi:hypothetical protein
MVYTQWIDERNLVMYAMCQNLTGHLEATETKLTPTSRSDRTKCMTAL